MLCVKKLSKRYGRHLVLDDISFELPSPGITFLMGENGAGKTTLVKAMLDLERFDGEVLYDQRCLRHAAAEVAVVFDDAPLYRGLSGYHNIELLCQRNGKSPGSCDLAVALLGDRMLRARVGRYSYGQRKKLSVACALMADPRYLIMDEVSNGLDYETMEFLKAELQRRSAECSIFLTGHQFTFYDSIVTRVLVLKDGRIDEFDHDPRSAPTASALGLLYERTVKGVS